MEPFKINIGQSILDDLKVRLSNARWTGEIENSDWEAGTSGSYLRALCDYWENNFDWRKQETYLNTFSHFKTEVDGVVLHFIHQKGNGKKRIPLLLIHGWPDSFVRFLNIIPMLTRADETGLCFDVVVPSIPGYGFSDIPTSPGMDKKKIAGLFTELMTNELGYDKFIAHGGDWGGGISEQIGLYHEKNLFGIHLTDVPFEHGMEEPKDASDEEKDYFKEIKKWQMTEGAYSMIQSTKPQSLAYGLNDSPVGLAAWLIEKFRSWSDNKGDIENAFSKDELLTNLMIYWSTQTIGPAIRIYYEAMQAMMNAMYNPLVKFNPFDKTGSRSNVPAGFAIFPKDISPPPRDLAERYFNIQHWTELDEGGHFAAMEKPELLEKDIRKFTAKIITGK